MRSQFASLNDVKAFLFMTTLPAPGAYDCPDPSRWREGKPGKPDLVSQILHSERIIKQNMKTFCPKLFTIFDEMPL